MLSQCTRWVDRDPSIMTKHFKSRRRFLALSGSATAAGLAGCMDFVSSDTSNKSYNDSSSNGDDSATGDGPDGDGGGHEPPELALETEYNSREEFKQPGEQFDDFEDEDNWELLYGGDVEVIDFDDLWTMRRNGH
jgi:hypothetical protein